MQPRQNEATESQRLARLIAKARGRSPGSLSDDERFELVRLYRFANSTLARAETRGSQRAERAELEALVSEAHAFLYRGVGRSRASFARRALDFFAVEVPRTVCAEWRIVAVACALMYGFALIAYFAVQDDLELAFALLSPEMVTQEIHGLQRTAAGEAFRGNFTFGLGESPGAAGWIMTHNMTVGVLFFASGLIPPLFLWLLAQNGLMLGTYTSVAAHWDQGFEISSILWCHGVLEIQALILAGAGGLVLTRAWIAPGPWSRRHAVRIASARAARLLAACFPMLFAAALIEGFVSPHAPLAMRIATAVLSGAVAIAWIASGWRSRGAVS